MKLETVEGLNSRFATAKSELLNWKTDLKKLQRIKDTDMASTKIGYDLENGTRRFDMRL